MYLYIFFSGLPEVRGFLGTYPKIPEVDLNVGSGNRGKYITETKY